MSANLLWNPGKVNTLTDDLESFLHVLGWTTLRYVPAINSYSARRRGKNMAMFDEHDLEEEDREQGGHQKRLVLRGESYPSDTFEPCTPTPLFGLLRQLSSPFKSLYSLSPPTAEARKNIDTLPNLADQSQLLSYATVLQYDNDMKCLQSSTWFIDTMKMALGKKWPTDDKADENLPIDFSGCTRRQVQNRTREIQRTQKLFEDSRGLSSSSKRARSPTAEPSAKRRRGTPPTSGSGI